jgi:integrase
MAKTINRLSIKKVDNLKTSGWHPDGNGLYLQVGKSGSKSWAYRYQVDGKQKWHGLGSYTKENSLQAARSAALKCKQLRKEGIDPIDHKNQLKIDGRLAAANQITFKECAEQYIKSHREGWKNQKHASQWENTLDTYAYPFIGDLAVQVIDGDLVMRVLEPIWFTKTETASRVRQRIENILDWATVKKYRQGDNPALWRGRLDKLLPKRTKVQRPKHFPAMDYRDLPDYFISLRSKKTIASNALAFTILTATRNGEARSASYSEIDQRSNVWIIPASRMKAEREHRIPLSDEAIAIITEMKDYKRTTDDFVFTGLRPGRAISEAALLKLVKATHPKLTVHGFRSSFRDWCAEQTSFTREVAEAALAHSIKDKTEAAYQRGDLFDKRRSLMNDWTDYCLSGKTQ